MPVGVVTAPCCRGEQQGHTDRTVGIHQLLVNDTGMSGFSHKQQECHLPPLLLQPISSSVPRGLAGGDRALIKPP